MATNLEKLLRRATERNSGVRIELGKLVANITDISTGVTPVIICIHSSMRNSIIICIHSSMRNSIHSSHIMTVYIKRGLIPDIEIYNLKSKDSDINIAKKTLESIYTGSQIKIIE